MDFCGVIPSEAIYGFAAWLTTRKSTIAIGSHCDCSPIVQLVDEYCKVNEFCDPRDFIYPFNLKQPEELLEEKSVVVAEEGNGHCDWVYDSDSEHYDTGCGEAYYFIEGTLEENRAHFCSFCGKRINEVAWDDDMEENPINF
jgi:hypothetical protein